MTNENNEKIIGDIEGLEKGIKQCHKNIATFETAIAGEQNTIADYRRMIGVLKEKVSGHSN